MDGLASIPETSVVLVGNGRSLLERPGLGRSIDGFGRAVRFNDFQAVGFEPFVGARTDWWARNELPSPRSRSERFERILVRPRMETEESYARSANEARLELQATHPGVPVEWIERDVYVELQAAYGFRNPPFTGTLVVAHLLRRIDRLHLCGFDGLSGGEEALRHYYSEGNVVGDWDAYHEHELDARYLRERADEGRIVFL